MPEGLGARRLQIDDHLLLRRGAADEYRSLRRKVHRRRVVGRPRRPPVPPRSCDRPRCGTTSGSGRRRLRQSRAGSRSPAATARLARCGRRSRSGPLPGAPGGRVRGRHSSARRFPASRPARCRTPPCGRRPGRSEVSQRDPHVGHERLGPADVGLRAGRKSLRLQGIGAEPSDDVEVAPRLVPAAGRAEADHPMGMGKSGEQGLRPRSRTGAPDHPARRATTRPHGQVRSAPARAASPIPGSRRSLRRSGSPGRRRIRG